MSGFFELPDKPEAKAPAPTPAPAVNPKKSAGGYLDRMLTARRARIAPITGEAVGGRYKVRARWDVG